MSTGAGFLARAEPQPDALKGCGAQHPTESWRYCSADRWSWGRPRACWGCGGHVHSWARSDAVYCSTRCRMRALRARKRAARDG